MNMEVAPQPDRSARRGILRAAFLLLCIVASTLLLQRTLSTAPKAYQLLTRSEEVRAVVQSETSPHDIAFTRMLDEELYVTRAVPAPPPATTSKGPVLLLFGSSKCLSCVDAVSGWIKTARRLTSDVRLVIPAEDSPVGPLSQALAASNLPFITLSPHRTDVYRVVSGVTLMPMAVVATSNRIACVILGPPSDATTDTCVSHVANPSLGAQVITTAKVEQWGLEEAYGAKIPPKRN